MQVTYTGHSGFLVELDRTLLLFDWIGEGMPPLDPGKRLYVFASHAHGDHFDPRVFGATAGHPDRHFVFSSDIRGSRGIPGTLREAICFLEPHRRVGMDGVTVETLDSTDQGAAFAVSAEGKDLLHMGDLHWWVWDDEPEADNERVQAKWRAELKRIAGRHFHAVFAVLDPRQEGEFWRGLDELMGVIQADAVYPMHMWDQPGLVDRLRAMPCSAPYRDKLPPVSFYQKP